MLAPLELERLRGAVRAGLFAEPAVLPKVGRYTLLRCIGHGGMGIVYAARDEELGREVAIKLLRAELASDDEGRLTREARALARLAHPNVVAVFDVGVHDGQRFIAMELVNGEDLRRWLASPRSLREVLRVFVAAAHGLAAAHEVGLVHRDFKPDNVLVGDDGRPRVLDFGLARPPDVAADATGTPPSLPRGVDPFATTFTSAGQLLGTPAYMAPEQYLGEPADARSDQFSFAVALYHAVYGERPFAGDDPQALALSIVRGRVRPVTPRYPVPAWLEAVLVQALRVDPAGRFASMQALVAVIEAELERTDPHVLESLPTRAFVAGPRVTGSAALALFDEPSAASTPTARGVAVAPTSPAIATAMPPESEHGDRITAISTRRSLPHAISEGALGRITRELDRATRRRGKVTRLGTGLTWSTPGLEVHVDIDAAGTRLLVWRRLVPELRRAQVLHAIVGFFLGTLAISIVEGIGLLHTDFDGLIIFGLLGLGLSMGVHVAGERAARTLPARRAELEFVADRLLQLACARELPLPIES